MQFPRRDEKILNKIETPQGEIEFAHEGSNKFGFFLQGGHLVAVRFSPLSVTLLNLKMKKIQHYQLVLNKKFPKL